jgi:hypothetical protein
LNRKTKETTTQKQNPTVAANFLGARSVNLVGIDNNLAILMAINLNGLNFPFVNALIPKSSVRKTIG